MWWYRPTKSWDSSVFPFLPLFFPVSAGWVFPIIRFCVHEALLGRQPEALFIIGLDFCFLYRNLRGSGKEHLTLCEAQNTVEIWNLLLWTRALWEKTRLPVLEEGMQPGFQTSATLQTHFNEVHAKRPQLPVSDRHVYKYRCNQCSLAFKTVEKLQLHSVPCDQSCHHVLSCQRRARSFQALKHSRQATWSWVRPTSSFMVSLLCLMGTSWQWGTPPWPRTTP